MKLALKFFFEFKNIQKIKSKSFIFDVRIDLRREEDSNTISPIERIITILINDTMTKKEFKTI